MFENLRHVLLRMVKGSLPIVLCDWNPYDLIYVVGRFSVILQPLDFNKAEFTCTSGAGKTARKIRKIPRYLGF